MLSQEISKCEKTNFVYVKGESNFEIIPYQQLKKLLNKTEKLIVSKQDRIICNKNTIVKILENCKTQRDITFYNNILQNLKNSQIKSNDIDEDDFEELKNECIEYTNSLLEKDCEEEENVKKTKKSSNKTNSKRNYQKRDINELLKKLGDDKMLNVSNYPSITTIKKVSYSKKLYFSDDLPVASENLENYKKALDDLEGDYTKDLIFVKNQFEGKIEKRDGPGKKSNSDNKKKPNKKEEIELDIEFVDEEEESLIENIPTFPVIKILPSKYQVEEINIL